MPRPVYLDNAATTPMDPRVFEAMRPWFLEHYGNASSANHLFGWEARDAVEEAREQVAALIGARSKEVVFTSGATEAVNLALKGVAERSGFRDVHIVTCNTEHRAVLDVCLHLERLGCAVTRLGVSPDGRLDLDDLESSIRPETRLIALMHANNETGVLHPIREIAGIARRRQVLFFCDATQTAGRLPLDVGGSGIDLMAFSAHKFHGPKGVGALFVNGRSEDGKPVAQMDGGAQERGLRSGTLNVPGIVGMGKAAQIARQSMVEDVPRIRELRDRLETSMLSMPGVRLNGHTTERLHTISNLSFEGVEAQTLTRALAARVAVSTGSACSSSQQTPSHVLKAMRVTDLLALGSLRFSLGKYNTDAEVDLAILALADYLVRR
jgi:cysteine desulfurase